DKKEFQGHTRVKTMIVAPTKEDPGWRGKIMRGINSLATKLETLSSDEAIKFLTSFEGVKEGDAANLYENLFKPRQTKPRVIRGVDRLREGQIEALSDRNRDLIIRLVKELQPVRIDERGGVSLDGIVQRGETDEPVTSDIKRLIRMPSSLHGKTGLQVVPLSREAIDEFRPLRDAVPRAWTDDRIRMNLKNKISLEIRGEVFNLAPGVNDVPQYLMAKSSMARAIRTAGFAIGLAVVLLLAVTPSLTASLFSDAPQNLHLGSRNQEAIAFTSPDPLGVSFVTHATVIVTQGQALVTLLRNNVSLARVNLSAPERDTLDVEPTMWEGFASWSLVVRNTLG